MRTTFSSSNLVRLLGEWVPAAPDTPGMDFAERLSLQLNPLDAIALQAVNQQVRARRPAARTTSPALARKLRDDLERVRGTLAHAIAQEVEPFFDVPLPGRGKSRASLPSPAEAAWSGYQHRHAALQRQMDQMVAAVRDHVRQALSAASPRLQQLAALDATLEKVLAAREQAALPRIPRLLQRRFEQLRKDHEHAIAQDGGEDDPASWSRDGGWLHAFGRDWRRVLLAERDLRLDPVAGLVEAAATDTH